MSAPGPAGPRTARLINDRRAYDLLLERGPLTRAELRALTGLSRPSVGDLVTRLEDQGLIAVVGESGAERRGPNARLYGVVADRAYAVGVEVRADTVAAVLVDVAGQEVCRATIPQSDDTTPDRLVTSAVVAVLSKAAVPRQRLGAVVVGTPGLVDPRSGDVSYVASLPSWHANLLAGLRAEFDSPVVVENEVNLVGLAELRLGAARGRDTFVLLWLGVGVGAAVILGGRLFRGVSGGAGEVAYTPVGRDESLQSVAGAAAVRAIAARSGIDVSGDLGTVMEAGLSDPRFLETLADGVVLGAAALCSVLDPGLVVLGGPVGRSGGDVLASAVEERLVKSTPSRTIVRPTELGGDPVVRGAVLVALDTIHDQAFGS